MSQRHFRDDPIMGKTVEIDGKPWTVIDVWVDIGDRDDAPRSVTLEYADEEDGDDDHFSLPREEVDRMPAFEAMP
jgi:hypothetical protein